MNCKTCEFCGGIKYHPKTPFSYSEEIEHNKTLLAFEKAEAHICGCKDDSGEY